MSNKYSHFPYIDFPYIDDFCDDEVYVFSTMGKGPSGEVGNPGPQGEKGDPGKDGILSFNTVADMKASTDLKAGMTAHTNGFYSSGDSGAAYYSISDSGTANEIDVLELQNGLYATLIITEPYVIPEMYGAVGNGFANDTAAFNIAVRNANSKNIPIIATGTYVIDSFTEDIGTIDGMCLGILVMSAPIALNENTKLLNLTIQNASTDVIYYTTEDYTTNNTEVTTTVNNCNIYVGENKSAIHLHLYNGRGLFGFNVSNTRAYSLDGATMFAFMRISTLQDEPSRSWVTGLYLFNCGTYENAQYFLYVDDAVNVGGTYSVSLLSINVDNCYFQWTENSQYFMRIRDVRNARVSNIRIYDATQPQIIYFANATNSLYLFEALPTTSTIENFGAGVENWLSCVYSCYANNKYNYMGLSNPYGNTEFPTQQVPTMYVIHDAHRKGIMLPKDSHDPSDNRGLIAIYKNNSNHLFYEFNTTSGTEPRVSEIYNAAYPFTTGPSTEENPTGRPVPPSGGLMCFDLNLQKPIWYSAQQGKWLDATGAAV